MGILRTVGACLRVRVATPWLAGGVAMSLAACLASAGAGAQEVGLPYPRLANMYLQGAVDAGRSASACTLGRAHSRQQCATRPLAATPGLEPQHQDFPLRLPLLPAITAAAVARLAADELQLRQHEQPLVAQLEPDDRHAIGRGRSSPTSPSWPLPARKARGGSTSRRASSSSCVTFPKSTASSTTTSGRPSDGSRVEPSRWTAIAIRPTTPPAATASWTRMRWWTRCGIVHCEPWRKTPARVSTMWSRRAAAGRWRSSRTARPTTSRG